ncbi:NAD(P)-binding domain-containing protein [Streptomyces adustus]|uniref:NAD(P)-binding domain-containing protein n=1 Tax=Streptomyces adustus TaxID=1609272 RepID=UPI00192E3E0C
MMKTADESTRLRPVTVLGPGPMGRALAAALLAARHPVTVWNRTAPPCPRGRSGDDERRARHRDASR